MVPRQWLCGVTRVLIVAAEHWELKYIRPRPNWRLAANGPGPLLAAAAVSDDADVVVSTGLCGALVPDLRIGDVVVGTAVNGVPVETLPGGFAGPLASIDRVAATVAEKRELARTGAVAVEMEAAGVLDRARVLGQRFYCVKAVSDAADEGFTLDFNAAREPSGRFSVRRILAQAARRPLVVGPELIRLKRASDRAARALEDFFERCSL